MQGRDEIAECPRPLLGPGFQESQQCSVLELSPVCVDNSDLPGESSREKLWKSALQSRNFQFWIHCTRNNPKTLKFNFQRISRKLNRCDIFKRQSPVIPGWKIVHSRLCRLFVSSDCPDQRRTWLVRASNYNPIRLLFLMWGCVCAIN